MDQDLKLAYPNAPSLSFLSSQIVHLRPLIQVRRCRYFLAHVHTCSPMSLCRTVTAVSIVSSAVDPQVVQAEPMHQRIHQHPHGIHRLGR